MVFDGLHRIHFAFTVTYHYLFPQQTMGLDLLIFILKTKRSVVMKPPIWPRRWVGSRFYQEMPPIPERVVTTDGQVV